MTLLFGADARVGRWAAQKLKMAPMGALHAGFVPPFVAIGVVDETDNLTGAVVFNAYNGHCIEMTMVGRGAMRRGVFAAIAAYVFRQIRCVRLEITVHASNKRVIDMARRAGFVTEGTLRRRFGDDDGVVLGMLKDECLWLRS